MEKIRKPPPKSQHENQKKFQKELYTPRIHKQSLRFNTLKFEDQFHYHIFKKHNYLKSAAFFIDEYLDLLWKEYGFKCLHHGKGNSRHVYRKKLERLFLESPLFRKDWKGQWYAVSEQKIHKLTGKRAAYINLSLDDLKSLQAFKMAMTRATALFYGNISYKKIGKKNNCCKITAYSRIRKAIQAGQIEKYNNMVMLKEFPNMESALIIQQSLYEQTGKRLLTRIIKMDHVYYLCGYLQNTFSDTICKRAATYHREKADEDNDRLIMMDRFAIKNQCFYRPYKLYDDQKFSCNLFMPKDSDFTIGDYMRAHFNG
jgi:hypothetical protein